MDFLTDFESEYAEVDPAGRYGRYNEVLGKGASKIVYRAFDEYEGIEVAWNQVKLHDFLQSPQDLERLYCEIHLLKTLNHGNIMKFFASWVDTSKNNINFITELFNSGTLRQYRLKHKRVSTRAVKHWCRQILKGLLYLHSQDPPVIHRDLKCDNIFINGNHGEVKIGDLGLAAILFQSHAAHCVGTPEFMAPEVYGEEYNELVDIYSFGMCILELVTFEIPYSECTNPVQIYKKVISGKKPDALYKVKDPELRQFIEKCLVTVSSRLSARELLFDPYLRTDDYSCDLRSIDFNSDCSYPNQYCNSNSNDYDHYNDEWKKYPVEIEANGIELFEFDHHDGEEHSPDASVTIKGKRREDGSIFLRLKITDKEGEIRNIYFPFDVEMDTSLTVAMEMVGELDITDHDVTYIAQMIDGEISKLVPEWKLEMDFEELSLNCSLSHTSFSSCIEFFSVTPGHNSSDSCGAIHGRFEEIVYKADGSEPDVQLTENWDCPESVEFSSLDSATSRHSENDQLDKPISYKKEKYGGWKEVLENFCSDLSFPSMQQAISASVEWEMRWLKAKHQLEAREVMNA